MTNTSSNVVNCVLPATYFGYYSVSIELNSLDERYMFTYTNTVVTVPHSVLHSQETNYKQHKQIITR